MLGLGLAEHAGFGSVGTLSLLQLWAPALEGTHNVECVGLPPSKDFLRVLEAIPHADLRRMANEGLAAGKAVRLKYASKSVELTIDNATSRLEW